MRFDYNETLRQQIHDLKNILDLTDVTFVVNSEQSFIKSSTLKPNTIYVLTKELQNDNSIGVDTQPVQILILAEQNSLEIAKSFFSEFAKKYNFEAFTQTYEEDGETHNIWVKQQYSDPVVLSNFNTVSYGYRSVLYVSATLYIMYDIADVSSLKIDNVDYKVLTFDLSYNMSPNTQQLPDEYISHSIKSASSMVITITIPAVSSSLINKVMAILNETDSVSTDPNDTRSLGGNENFYFDFYIGAAHFENKKFKLNLVDFGSAINNVPSIRLGFIK